MLSKKEKRQIKEHCDNDSILTSRLIDNDILDYSNWKDNTAEKFNHQLLKHVKAARELPESTINFLRAQHMAFQVFKKNGLIRKYLKKGVYDHKSKAEKAFLQNFVEHPLQFTFCIILENLGDDFYIMGDLFTDAEMLVYSPGVTRTLKDTNQTARSWLLMVYNNGLCYQSYGPIIYFKSLGLDDFFYFGMVKNRNISTPENLAVDLNKDPLPYCLLMNFSEIPIMVSRGHATAIIFSISEVSSMNMKDLEKDFIIEYKKGIYRLSLKSLEIFPHFAKAYYDKENEELHLHTMTIEAYDSMVESFQKYGHPVYYEPDFILNTIIGTITKTILGKKVKIDEFEDLFEKREKASPTEQKQLDDINTFLRLLMTELNEKRKPDLQKLAKEAGISIDTALDLYKGLKDQFGRL